MTDCGYLVRIDLDSEVAVVAFDKQFVEYEFTQLDQLLHAYAVSVHKSQGSEYPVVVIPQHVMMWQRNLLYTAITALRRLWS